MDQERKLSEKESLKIITEMIVQAKGGYYHDSGIGAILWGTVVAFAGFMSFLQLYFNWSWTFDWWLLALFAIIPQIFISIRERKNNVVKTHVGLALDTVWVIFGISIFCIILYIHKAPEMGNVFLQEDGIRLLRENLETGEIAPYKLTIAPSVGSLLLLIYAIPTMVTGVVKKFWPMITGAIITYIFFLISLYTRNPIDQLLMGISGLVNWLIPGLMLRFRYTQSSDKAHV
ncbi:MAG: hypothetical protein MUE99_01555 [Chitinophagaceae bacterium]|nr:hypothetical protein [Chitinophagaceae bacterium]